MINPIQNKTNTIFVHVSNLKKSAKWYGKLLNQEVDVSEVTRPVYNIQMNQYTGLTLDAGPADQEKKIIPIAYPLFNFHTEDIHQAFNYIKELGYQIESDIVEFDDFAYFNISDPDHNIIMICNG